MAGDTHGYIEGRQHLVVCGPAHLRTGLRSRRLQWVASTAVWQPHLQQQQGIEIHCSQHMLSLQVTARPGFSRVLSGHTCDSAGGGQHV
jgi:hypothetical protein